jgi:hypothetical protein
LIGCSIILESKFGYMRSVIKWVMRLKCIPEMY